MNSINAKSVQLIELHAFAYCLLSVSLSESFDCFVDRIRDAISNRVTMDNSICFLDKIDLCPLCTSAGQKTEKTKNQNLYYMPSFHD